MGEITGRISIEELRSIVNKLQGVLDRTWMFEALDELEYLRSYQDLGEVAPRDSDPIPYKLTGKNV